MALKKLLINSKTLNKIKKTNATAKNFIIFVFKHLITSPFLRPITKSRGVALRDAL
jgi:hypothetical protein